MTRKRISKRVLDIGILVVGLLVMIASIISYSASVEVSEDYVPTKATIIDIEQHNLNGKDTHKVLIRYNIDGDVYSRTLDYYDSSLSVGDEINIAYNKDTWLDIIYIDKYRESSVVFIVIGAVLTTLGITEIVRASQRNKKYKRGRVLKLGTITEITKDVSSKTNEYIIVATVKNPRTEMLMEIRDSLSEEQAKAFNRGDSIDIMIDLDENIAYLYKN